MTYGFADFVWLILFAWLIVFVLHQTIGGLLGLIPGVAHKKIIEIANTWNKP